MSANFNQLLFDIQNMPLPKPRDETYHSAGNLSPPFIPLDPFSLEPTSWEQVRPMGQPQQYYANMLRPGEILTITLDGYGNTTELRTHRGDMAFSGQMNPQDFAAAMARTNFDEVPPAVLPMDPLQQVLLTLECIAPTLDHLVPALEYPAQMWSGFVPPPAPMDSLPLSAPPPASSRCQKSPSSLHPGPADAMAEKPRKPSKRGKPFEFITETPRSMKKAGDADYQPGYQRNRSNFRQPKELQKAKAWDENPKKGRI